MQLKINDIDKEFEEGITIDQIMQRLQVKDKVMAVAVNMDIVKKDSWNSFVPKEGDEIEMLHFVGGG